MGESKRIAKKRLNCHWQKTFQSKDHMENGIRKFRIETERKKKLPIKKVKICWEWKFDSRKSALDQFRNERMAKRNKFPGLDLKFDLKIEAIWKRNTRSKTIKIEKKQNLVEKLTNDKQIQKMRMHVWTQRQNWVMIGEEWCPKSRPTNR